MLAKPTELAEFCAYIFPRVWTGSFRQSTARFKHHATFTIYLRTLFERFKSYTRLYEIQETFSVCIFLALFYVHRLRSANPTVHGSKGSEARIFTTALMIAYKYYTDYTFLPSVLEQWEYVSHILSTELRSMEIEFLTGIDNTIGVHASDFFRFSIQCQYWLQLMIKDPELSRTRTMKMHRFSKLFENKEQVPSSSLSPSKRKHSVDDKRQQQQQQIVAKGPTKRRRQNDISKSQGYQFVRHPGSPREVSTIDREIVKRG
ncbi:hypothetical protein INT45_004361 [Circinella minor]|uniref:Cyclin N-terminal domain-containing protein n=1 Tax=Circinella minor TaxID=1195481 RepID=A0A8H7S8F2_9FUNG|nr:hypothetical protein INT45_004361 [Circinella minor]